MNEKERKNYIGEDLEGERLTGGPSLKQLLFVLAIVLVVVVGAAAWFFEFGVSSQAKHERFVKMARESLSRGKINEAIIAFRRLTTLYLLSTDDVRGSEKMFV